MIQHINFIEREFIVLTYRKMLFFFGILLCVCLLILGLQTLHANIIENKVNQLTHQVNQLKAKRKNVLAKEEESRRGLGDGKTKLSNILEGAPKWSRVLESLTRKMPSDLWLVSLKTYQKVDVAGGRGVLLSGEALEAKQISLFLEEMAASSQFQKTLLNDSKQETRGGGRVFTFSIDTVLASPKGSQE